jgi:FKBP-type peptidyl-prolyl cis-trans isomerase
MHLMKNVVRLLCAAVLISSCNSVDFKKTKGGMPYKLFASKSGTKAEPGNYIKVNEIVKVNDSLIFSSYTTAPRYYPVTAAGNPYDLSEIYAQLKTGDSVYAEQAMDTFIKQNPAILQQTSFKNGDKLIHTIKVVEVFKSAELAQADEMKESSAAFDRDPKVQEQLQKDEKAITDYLAKNNITAQKVGKGTYVQILQEGTGPAIKTGDFVMINYKGLTMNGVEFDTNIDPKAGRKDPMPYQIGVQPVIKGFEEGIGTLKEGSKARLFIPSILAYGAQPPTPKIQPFENLIFEIDVVDVTNTPPAQPNPPMPQNFDTTGGQR